MNPSALPNGHLPYTIVASETVRDSIREFQQIATIDGRGQQFGSAFREILRRLQSNPNRLGEDLFYLPALKLKVRCAVIPPVSIHFGVDTERRIVYLRLMKLLAKS